MAGLSVEQVSFGDRAARSSYVAQRYGNILKGKILDAGCDRAVLRGLLRSVEYTGIDLTDEADLRLNFETVERLPFPDGSFDCVVCTDVLEHIENLHHIFGELVRVTGRYFIVSLPNNWVNARVPIQRGRGSFGKYGLPAEKPDDRHKWFFSLAEAVDFVEAQTKRHPIRIAEMHATEKSRALPVRALRRLRYANPMSYLNRYAHTAWFMLEKTDGR